MIWNTISLFLIFLKVWNKEDKTKKIMNYASDHL